LQYLYLSLCRLKKAYDDLHRKSPLTLTLAQRDFIQRVISARWDKMYSDAHGAAYLLDPRYNGAGMDSNSLELTEIFISEYTVIEGESTAVRQMRLAEYFQYQEWVRRHSAANSVQYKLLFAENAASRMSPLQFWVTRGVSWPLVQPLAMRLFSLCCTSCESERAFSSLGFIHSKVRNRLGVQKADMLAFVKANDEILDKLRSITIESDIDEDE